MELPPDPAAAERLGDPGADRLADAEARHGTPKVVTLEQEVRPWELDLIEKVCGDRRHHDVTVFAFRDLDLALVHKPSDPPGVWWAPAGGVAPGEQLWEAAERETHEEAGVTVRATRYLLRVDALFRCGDRRRSWTSHVLIAEWCSGEPAPVDIREVESASWVTVDRFLADVVPSMREAGWGRFEYRLRMAEMVFEELGLAGGTGGPPRIQCSDRRQ